MKTKLSKTGFKQFLDAPMHMWAYAHERGEVEPDDFDILLGRQGYMAEQYAKVYLEGVLAANPAKELIWQKQFEDDDFILRADALVCQSATDSYDLYEIKSGSSLKDDYLDDAAFQHVVLSRKIRIDRVYILHLNKEYVRQGDLDANELFIAEDVTEEIRDYVQEVESLLPRALHDLLKETPDGVDSCLKPDSCPCPSL